MSVKINSFNKYFAISFLLIFGIIGCSKNNYSTNTNMNAGNVPGANEIWMQNIAFTPGTLTIGVGTSIKWTNKESITHTVTSGLPGAPDGIFNSGNLGNGGTFSFTFNTKGTFKYYCIIHGAMMTGNIIVQ